MAEQKIKTCCRCGRELPASAFYKNARSKDGLAAYCKECNRVCQRECLIKKSHQLKFCVGCKRDLPLSEFYIKHNRKIAMCSYCKECRQRAAARKKAEPPKHLKESIRSMVERVRVIDQETAELAGSRAAILAAAGNLLKANRLRKVDCPGVGVLEVKKEAVSIAFEGESKEG